MVLLRPPRVGRLRALIDDGCPGKRHIEVGRVRGIRPNRLRSRNSRISCSAHQPHPLTHLVAAQPLVEHTVENIDKAFGEKVILEKFSTNITRGERLVEIAEQAKGAAAKALLKHNPGMTFLYVSGAGTDSSEKGGAMWARVKGRTENALLALPFKAAFMFRPAMIQPLHGEVSKTKVYRVVYALLWPVLPLFKVLLPGQVTTTERVGRAMLEVVRRGGASRVVENREINEIGGG